MELKSAVLLALVCFACLSGLAAAAVCEGYTSPKQCLGPTGSGVWSDAGAKGGGAPTRPAADPPHEAGPAYPPCVCAHAGRCAWFGPADGGICITTPEQLPSGRAAITSIGGPVAVPAPASPALQAPAPESGRRLLAPVACADVPTPEGYTCAQQKAWGKCAAGWMLTGGWCAQTCGRCMAAQRGSPASPTPATASPVELSSPVPALPSPPAPASSPAVPWPALLPPSLPSDVVSVLVPPAVVAGAADRGAQQQNLG